MQEIFLYFADYCAVRVTVSVCPPGVVAVMTAVPAAETVPVTLFVVMLTPVNISPFTVNVQSIFVLRMNSSSTAAVYDPPPPAAET